MYKCANCQFFITDSFPHYCLVTKQVVPFAEPEPPITRDELKALINRLEKLEESGEQDGI